MGNQAYRRLRQMHPLETLESLSDLVQSLDLSHLLSETGSQVLTEHGISQKYADKILESEMAIQYGQQLDSLNSLAVSIAAYNADEGRKVEGGSIISTLETILSKSNVDLRLSTEVFGVRKLNTTKWILASRHVGKVECWKTRSEERIMQYKMYGEFR